AGHQVTASTRSPDGQARLRAMGAEPAVMDGLDPAAGGEAVARARPEGVIHQMTALAAGTDLRHLDRGLAAPNRPRTEGPGHPPGRAPGAGAPPVNRAGLHRLVQHPYRRPGEDRAGPAGPGSAREPAADPGRDPLPGERGPRRARPGGHRAAVRRAVRSR